MAQIKSVSFVSVETVPSEPERRRREAATRATLDWAAEVVRRSAAATGRAATALAQAAAGDSENQDKKTVAGVAAVKEAWAALGEVIGELEP